MPLLLTLLLLLLPILTTPALAQTPRSGQLDELKQLTIEELADTDVTSASRRLERLADVAAAVTVIRGEDLRRMGVMSLPEALRLADHLHVAQVSGPQYAITARGFEISTANKMLVLIDGRTVYSPVYSGVFWEAQDVVIQDIDRIEITRGPGGSLWGANAVNGVINVITKSALDTKGTFVSASAGTSTLGPYTVRHGGRLGREGAYRAYVKVRFEDAHQLLSGINARDDFDFGQAGFRMESGNSASSQLMLQGDAYTGTTGQLDANESNISGGNVLARWSQTHGSHVSTVQAYFDHTYRRVPGQYRGTLNTVDIDAQHQWHAGRQNMVFGGGYRLYDGDDLGDGPGFFFEPRRRTSHRLNAFLQDEIALTEDVFLTLGSKFESNEFTGVEVQPTIRMRRSAGKHSLWGAVSRAVRVPTRFDTDLRFRNPGTDTLLLTGSADFRSENVLAYEAGYRQLLDERVSIDVAGYVNRYDDLRTQEVTPGAPITLDNMMNALSRGIEATVTAQLAPRWQMHYSHSYLWKEFTFDPGSSDPTHGTSEANDPTHFFKVRSYLTVSRHIELDMRFRYYASLPQPFVGAYSEFDTRLGYRVKPGWDLSLIGANLLHPRHLEFRAGTAPETYERAITLRSVWHF